MQAGNIASGGRGTEIERGYRSIKPPENAAFLLSFSPGLL